MKKMIYLINHELSTILKKIFSVTFFMITAELISFIFTTSNEDNEYLRFEEISHMSGAQTIFYISFFVVLGIIAYSFYKNWMGSKSIYSLMCLPVPRHYIYVSKFTAAVISVGLLIAAQLINIFFIYSVYLFAFPQVPKVKNGLLLAFLRWDFFKLFYPTELITAITSLSYILLAVTAVLFIVAAERASKYISIALVIIPALLLIVLPFGSITKLILLGFFIFIVSNRTLSLLNKAA